MGNYTEMIRYCMAKRCSYMPRLGIVKSRTEENKKGFDTGSMQQQCISLFYFPWCLNNGVCLQQNKVIPQRPSKKEQSVVRGGGRMRKKSWLKIQMCTSVLEAAVHLEARSIAEEEAWGVGRSLWRRD